VILGCLGLGALYATLSNLRVDRQAVFFYSGLLLLFLALESPLDVLSDDYLFSAHMLQHLVLILFVAPLLLLGMPSYWIERILSWIPAGRLERILGKPVVAWSFGVGTLYFWHIPVFYNAAVANENIHTLEHICFLISAVIFWWPVIVPIQEIRRLSAFGNMLYIFAGAVANVVLGIVITFSSVSLYPAYIHPEDAFGILPFIRNGFGLTPQSDLQLGGLMMWIPGGIFYLSAILIAFAHWFHQPDLEVT
jgi:cytochrome c oxidase assembly factor CtaG